MSRQYNPSITAYNRLNSELSKKPTEPVKRNAGLLGPKQDRMQSTSDESLDQPINRIKKHMISIRNYRENKHA